jgi:hypothetical protein
MDPITILALVNGSISLIETALPAIQQAVQKGDITPTQQSELLARYNSLKAKADGQFQGPEWQIS